MNARELESRNTSAFIRIREISTHKTAWAVGEINLVNAEFKIFKERKVLRWRKDKSINKARQKASKARQKLGFDSNGNPSLKDSTSKKPAQVPTKRLRTALLRNS